MPPGSKRGNDRVKPHAVLLEESPNAGDSSSDTSANECDMDDGAEEQHPAYDQNIQPPKPTSDWAPSLALTLFHLRKLGLLKVSDYCKLHTLKHPVPFIGLEGGRKGNIYTFQGAYEFIGAQAVSSHPGHPSVPPGKEPGGLSMLPAISTPHTSREVWNRRLRPRLTMALNTTTTMLPATILEEKEEISHKQGVYDQCNGLGSIQDISKELYFHAPNLERRAPLTGYTTSQDQVEPYYTEMENCISLICRNFVRLCNKLVSALPLRIGSGYDVPYPGAPMQWALLLTFKDDQEILLPLALSLHGQECDAGSLKNTLYLQGWTIDHGFLLRPEGLESSKRAEYYKSLEEVSRVFRVVPVLHIKDIEFLFKRPQPGWRARRYASIWTLYMGPIHANYQCETYYSPVIGVFSDVGLLLNSVLERGARVSFQKTLTGLPFELVKLRQFSIENCNGHPEEGLLVLTQALVGGLRPNSQISLDDGGEHTPAPVTALKPASIHNAPELRRSYLKKKKQRHSERTALLGTLQAPCRFVDGLRKCELPTCPLPAQQPKSNFCTYHTETLLKHLEAAEEIDIRHGKWQLSCERLDDERKKDLRALKKCYAEMPHKTWVIDFEFITLGGKWSPIPLQLAIRTIDGKLLLAENVDYNLKAEEMLAQIAALGSVPQRMASFLRRCYGEAKTNGRTPKELKHIILEELKYDKNSINILSWYSVHDMQCFQRIITAEDNELIVPRHTHLGARNFQQIKLHVLLKGLLPPTWSSSLKLSVVHSSLLHNQGRKPKELNYHTAEYDTEAVTDLVEEMIGLQ
ncbi:hypothetical protein BJX70DRAFT_397802 [Aspergillus crustosus]